ncbi:hypothetical protein RFI_39659, partial [Reticulomyxa filosa]
KCYAQNNNRCIYLNDYHDNLDADPDDEVDDNKSDYSNDMDDGNDTADGNKSGVSGLRAPKVHRGVSSKSESKKEKAASKKRKVPKKEKASSKKGKAKTVALAYKKSAVVKYVTDELGKRVPKKVRMPNVLNYEDIRSGDELLTDNGDVWWKELRAKWQRWKQVNEIKEHEIEHQQWERILEQVQLFKEKTTDLLLWIHEQSPELYAKI